jgi:hypothetical protein
MGWVVGPAARMRSRRRSGRISPWAISTSISTTSTTSFLQAPPCRRAPASRRSPSSRAISAAWIVSAQEWSGASHTASPSIRRLAVRIFMGTSSFRLPARQPRGEGFGVFEIGGRHGLADDGEHGAGEVVAVFQQGEVGKRAVQERRLSRLAFSTTATGVSADRPASTSRAAISAATERPI